jgi:hypothetical protein
MVLERRGTDEKYPNGRRKQAPKHRGAFRPQSLEFLDLVERDRTGKIKRKGWH